MKFLDKLFGKQEETPVYVGKAEFVNYLHDIGLLSSRFYNLYDENADWCDIANTINDSNENLLSYKKYHAMYNSKTANECTYLYNLIKYNEVEIFLLIKYNRKINLFHYYNNKVDYETVKKNITSLLKEVKNISKDDKELLNSSFQSSKERKQEFSNKIYSKLQAESNSLIKDYL